MEIVCAMSATPAHVRNHLPPLARHPRVKRIWLLRPGEERFDDIPKVRTVNLPASKPRRFAALAVQARRLCRARPVAAAVSFNPIPYGLILHSAVEGRGVPVHFGFIGSDWYRDTQGRLAALRPALQKGDFITATGRAMRDEMIASGFDTERVQVLPHTVDAARFYSDPSGRHPKRLVFVGGLHPVKRVDTLLDAMPRVVARHPGAELVIVGDGPERGALEAQRATLGLTSQQVQFVGRTDDVPLQLRSASVFVLASRSEGWPFALVEALCAGLVPVVTDVGTIAEHIHHDVNGLFFPVGDAGALAGAVGDLFDDAARLARLREAGAASRAHFDHDAATAVWDSWLSTL